MGSSNASATPPPSTLVRHHEWGPSVVLRTEQDRITVLFEDAGYKTLSLPAVHDNNLLIPAEQR